jgi:hypothetical protein
MGRARAAARNLMNQDRQRWFDTACYIPGAVTSTLVGAVETVKRRLAA